MHRTYPRDMGGAHQIRSWSRDVLLAKSKRTARSKGMREAAELSVLAADWILRAKDGKGLSTDAILMAVSAHRGR